MRAIFFSYVLCSFTTNANTTKNVQSTSFKSPGPQGLFDRCILGLWYSKTCIKLVCSETFHFLSVNIIESASKTKTAEGEEKKEKKEQGKIFSKVPGQLTYRNFDHVTIQISQVRESEEHLILKISILWQGES